ncbi:MAG: tetratricopeptide repeat protein [Tolypothrix carrinoi HA7290-LM1]|nr:tetratricopeptide repeat protein [Tolypothrix carrinoi HA7290-LM1]
MKLYQQGTAESLRQAIGKWEEALKLYQQIDDKQWEAITFLGIGRVFSDLGEKQKALSYYDQALPLLRQVGDKGSEAATLNNIGTVYSNLGEKQKALSYFDQALPLLRQVGDKGVEATTLNNIGQVFSDLGEKQKALSYFDQALPLLRQVGNKGVEATTLSNIGKVYSNLGEKQKALSYYDQALPLRRQVGDKGGEATILTDIGGVYSDLGEKQKALTYYDQALPLYRQVGDKGGEATTLNNIGLVYDDLGEKQKALSYYDQALPLRRQMGDKGGEATTLNNIGLVYNDLAEKRKALSYFDQALPLYRQVGDKSGEATTLNNIGAVYNDLGEKQKALSYYNQALPLLRQVGDKGGEANTLSNIGTVYFDLGEKQKALSYFDQALPLLRQVGDKGGEATTLNNIGAVYSDLGEKQKALTYYDQALPLLRQVGDKSVEATTLSNIGAVYSDLGEKQKALEYLDQALPLVRQVGDKDGEATTLNNIGAVYRDLGEKQKALTYYDQALPLLRQVGNKGVEATTLTNIGLVYSDLGEKQKALTYYDQALPLRRQVGDKGGEATTLSNLASLERSKNNLQAALTHIETAINIIEDLRTKIDSQDLRTSYFASVQDYYEFKIDLLMQLHKKDRSKRYDALALDTNERSRARVLIELLTEANANIRKGANPQLLEQETSLLQRIEATEKLIKNLESQSQKDLIVKNSIEERKKERENLLNQYRELQTKIRTTNPEYAALKYPEPLKLPQIQQQLDKDTLLLQYSLGKDRSYLWAVTPDSLDSYELPGQKQIEDAANNFREVILAGGVPYGKSNPDAINKPASQLTQIILAPVANKLGKKRLVIVADGVLQNIPFAALADLTPQPPSLRGKGEYQSPSPLRRGVGGEVPYIPFAALADLTPQPPSLRSRSVSKRGKGENQSPSLLRRGVGGEVPYQPLLVNHQIVNLPSVTAIATQRQQLNKRQPAPKTLAILADPVFAADDKRVTGKEPAIVPDSNFDRSSLQRALKNLKRNGLMSLPNTRTEAEEILKLVSPSQSIHAYDFDANYNFATSKELKQYRFLQFATHGIVDTTNPELSGIVLSQIDKQGKPVEKGYLRLGDIFNLDLGAELVVLSACETGLGKNVKGEGLMGLTRGLMYAGSKRAVVSLWQVDDEGTSQLMPLFYKAILRGESPTSALRDAQLQLWQQKQWQNPYYWAAFTLQGDWR